MSKMTIGELIERLTELAETYGDDVEVRMATQPHYPLQSTIAGLAVEAALTDQDREDLKMLEAAELTEDTLTDAQHARIGELCDRTAETVVYVLEGSSHSLATPYASKSLWDEA